MVDRVGMGLLIGVLVGLGDEVNCQDGIACTGDGCDAKTGCVHDALGTCSDGNDCTTDVCDLATGCTSSFNDGPCTEFEKCTTSAQCSQGKCVGQPACDDGNPCTGDYCTSTGCKHEGTPDAACGFGVVCSDQAVCPTSVHDTVVVPGIVSGMGAPAFIGCNPAEDPTCTAAEAPAHFAHLTAFAMDRREVTVGQFKHCVLAGKCAPQPTDCPESDPNLPVRWVTWFQAAMYCNWQDGTLPTEHQWEKASRGACQANAPPSARPPHLNILGETPPPTAVSPRMASAS